MANTSLPYVSSQYLVHQWQGPIELVTAGRSVYCFVAPQGGANVYSVSIYVNTANSSPGGNVTIAHRTAYTGTAITTTNLANINVGTTLNGNVLNSGPLAGPFVYGGVPFAPNDLLEITLDSQLGSFVGYAITEYSLPQTANVTS